MAEGGRKKRRRSVQASHRRRRRRRRTIWWWKSIKQLYDDNSGMYSGARSSSNITMAACVDTTCMRIKYEE
jgi:hypothetical protein